MSPRYWLNVFTGETWEEFLENGAEVSGFPESRGKIAAKIVPGDYLLCYLSGISRFIGVLEVQSDKYNDGTRIWKGGVFPVRFKVKLIHKLDPKSAIPVQELKDKLTIFNKFKPGSSGGKWSAPFRRSPTECKFEDGEVIVETIRQAINKPVERGFDEKKYWRSPRVYESTKLGTVTIPEELEESEEAEVIKVKPDISHEEIQWLLLKLGSNMGLDLWVARNDRNKEFNGEVFRKIPHVIDEIPRQFDEATNRTIEMIDVLWLHGDSFEGAFEIEHSTSIYSGLLRMSDLINLQPNLSIKLYIVAPDDRRDKVIQEIRRPTFKKLKPPLQTICKFIPYSKLKNEFEQVGHRAQYLRPEFIDEIAEVCEED